MAYTITFITQLKNKIRLRTDVEVGIRFDGLVELSGGTNTTELYAEIKVRINSTKI